MHINYRERCLLVCIYTLISEWLLDTDFFLYLPSLMQRLSFKRHLIDATVNLYAIVCILVFILRSIVLHTTEFNCWPMVQRYPLTPVDSLFSKTNAKKKTAELNWHSICLGRFDNEPIAGKKSTVKIRSEREESVSQFVLSEATSINLAVVCECECEWQSVNREYSKTGADDTYKVLCV